MRLNFFLKPIYSVFGIGYIKIGSGTFCSLLPCLIILFFGGNLGLFARLSILIIILIFGFLSTSFKFEDNGVELKDPHFVVIDEFIGMWIVLLIVEDSILLILLSFLLFRFFDITKFYPELLLKTKLQALQRQGEYRPPQNTIHHIPQIYYET